jgi:hypothetical protein
MNIQECPRIGQHCITLRAVINPPTHRPITSTSVITKMPIEMPTTLVEITPLSSFIDLLSSTEKTLSAMHGHPVDLALVGIETSGLSQLQLVVARKEEKQKRIDAVNVAETAEQEIKLAREMFARIKPLAMKIEQNTTTAEETMKVLLDEHNSAQARKMLLAHLQSPATVMHDLDVLSSGGEEPLGGARLVKGKKSHRLRVDILSIDREKTACTARLIKLESATELFKPGDIGLQSIQMSAYDQDSFFVLCQCAALGTPLSVMVSVDVSISSKCFHYRASLLSIPDKPDLVKQLKDQVISRATDMFSAG